MPGLTLVHPQSNNHQPTFSASRFRLLSLNLVPRSTQASGPLVSAFVGAHGSPTLLSEISSSFEEFPSLRLFPEDPSWNLEHWPPAEF